MAYLCEEVKDLFPEQVYILLVDTQTEIVSLLSMEQRDIFVERLKIYKSDTAELAAAISEAIYSEDCELR